MSDRRDLHDARHLALAIRKNMAGLATELDKALTQQSTLIEIIEQVAPTWDADRDDGQTTMEGQALRDEIEAIAVQVRELQEAPGAPPPEPPKKPKPKKKGGAATTSPP